MDYKDLTAISIKTAATVLLFWYVAAFPAAVVNVYFMFKNQAVYEQASHVAVLQGAVFALLPQLLGLLFALFVFLFPRSVSNKLVAGAPLSSQPEFLATFQYAALRLVGVYFIYRGLMDVAYYVTKLYVRDAEQVIAFGRTVPSSWSPDEAAGLVSSLVEIVVAVWIVLGARGILGVVDWLRGRDEPARD